MPEDSKPGSEPAAAVAESPRRRPARSQAQVKIELLDGTIMDLNIERKARGHDLLHRVCDELNIVEKDYFGLLHEDRGDPRVWLDLDKRVSKFFKGEPWQVRFAVKFYPPEPSQLGEELTRYQLVLGIRRDVLEGRLPCSAVTHALLASYLLQSELGDHQPQEEGAGHVKKLGLAPADACTPELEEKVVELHKNHRGQTPAEAELNYLENAKKLAMYGVDLHPARDSEGVEITLGVCSSGLWVYKDKLRMNRFAWPKILKISYKRHNFYVKLRPGEFDQYESTVGFKLANHRAAKKLWKVCVEHHTFFRLMSPEPAKSSTLFPRLGSRFRYSGRTHYETKKAPVQREAPNFSRSLSARKLSSRSMDALAKESSIPEAAKRHTMPPQPAPRPNAAKDKMSRRTSGGTASISSASSVEGEYVARDPPTAATNKKPLAGAVQVMPVPPKKVKEEPKRAQKQEPAPNVNGTDVNEGQQPLDSSNNIDTTPKKSKPSFFFGGLKKDKSPKDKSPKDKSPKEKSPKENLQKDKEKVSKEDKKTPKEKKGKDPKTTSKAAVLDTSNESSNLDTSAEKSPSKSEGSPDKPGFTKPYHYTETDPEKSPTRKPFIQGAFSYEKEPHAGEKNSPDDSQSPSTRRTTGLAFNYAPGEDKKVVESAEKRKTLQDKPVEKVTDPKIKTPGIDYVQSAALKEQAKADKMPQYDPSSALLDAERAHHDANVPAVLPNVGAISGKEIQLMVITAKYDHKTKKLDTANGQVDVSVGVVNALSGKIDTDYGLIDSKTGNILYTDPNTGKQETKHAHVDAKTGHLLLTSGVVDPKTGKVDATLGQQYIVVGKNDPLLKIVTITAKLNPNNKQLNTANGHIDNSTGVLDTESGLIITKYGSIDPNTGKLTIVDPKSGKQEVRQGNLDQKTGQILFTNGVLDPSTGKIDNSLGQQIIIAGENDAVINVITITGKVDPVTKKINTAAGTVDNSVGIQQSSNGLIQTKYGLVDPKSGIIVCTDPKTGKQEVKKADIDPKTGIITVNSGAINPSTGKPDESYGQQIILTGENDALVKIVTITARFDPRTRQLDSGSGDVEESPAILLKSNGFVQSKYGLIDPRSGQIYCTDPKTGKQEVKQSQVDPRTGHLILTSSVINPKTGEKDALLGQEMIIASPDDKVVKIFSATGKIDPKSKALDFSKSTIEATPAVMNTKTGQVSSKYGVIDSKSGQVVSVDPSTGKTDTKQGHIDNKTGHIILSSDVIDPKTGKADPTLGQRLVIGDENDVILKIVTIIAKVDSKTKQFDPSTLHVEITPGIQRANGHILTKYGEIEPETSHIVITDPKSGKHDSKKCHIDPASGQVTVTSGVIDPKTGKVDSSLGQCFLIANQNQPIVDVVTVTGKVDPKTNEIDVASSRTDIQPGVYIAETGQIITQNAIVDPKAGQITTIDTKSGKHGVPKQGKVDSKTAQITVTQGVVDPKTGKVDTGLLQIVKVQYRIERPETETHSRPETPIKSSSVIGTPVKPPSVPPSPVRKTPEPPVVAAAKPSTPTRVAPPTPIRAGAATPTRVATPTRAAPPTPTGDVKEPPKRKIVKIMVILTKLDPKTKKPDLHNAEVEHSTGILDTATGTIETKYGVIDSKTGNIIVTDPATGQKETREGSIEPKTRQIVVSSGAVNPKTGKFDPNLSQIFSVAKQDDPVVEITTITGKIDPVTGKINVAEGIIEHTKGKVDAETGNISTKYGVIDPANGMIYVTDTTSGVQDTKPITVNENTGQVTIAGVVDPKTGKIDPELHQLLAIGTHIDPVVEVTTFVGKVDAKKGVIEPKNSVIESTTGQLNPENNKIDTKYGQIDLVKGTVTYTDPKSGKLESRDVKVDPVTGQILLRGGQINPKSSKPDKDIGRLISLRIIQNKVDPISGKQVVDNDPRNVKVDPKTNQIWIAGPVDPKTGETIYTTGQIDPKTGYIITIYGHIDPKTGLITRTTEIDKSLVQVDPVTGQIYTATGQTDEDNSPLFSASQIEPSSGEIYTKIGKIDPQTGRLIVIKIYIITQKDDTGKVKEVDPKDCTIDETTGRVVTTKTVYVYQIVDPITGETIEVDPDDPRLMGARTTVTQTMTLSGKIDPITGRIKTEYGDIDPDSGDIDPSTAIRDPVTGQLILHYSQIDPSHFDDKTCNYSIEKETQDLPANIDIQTVNTTKFSTFGKNESATNGDEPKTVTEYTTSEHIRHQGIVSSTSQTPSSKIPISQRSKGSRSPTTPAAPVVVKTTTKQLLTKNEDGVTHNVEQEVENLRTGEVTYSTQTNKAESVEPVSESGGKSPYVTARAVTTRTATTHEDLGTNARTQQLEEKTVAHTLTSSATRQEQRVLTQQVKTTVTTGDQLARRGSTSSVSSGDSGTPIDFEEGQGDSALHGTTPGGVTQTSSIITSAPLTGISQTSSQSVPSGEPRVSEDEEHEIGPDGEIVSSQTISSKTRTVETITYKTERDGVVETRVEQKITIQSDGDPIDHDRALAEAIQEATAMNPDMTVEKIEIQQQSTQP